MRQGLWKKIQLLFFENVGLEKQAVCVCGDGEISRNISFNKHGTYVQRLANEVESIFGRFQNGADGGFERREEKTRIRAKYLLLSRYLENRGERRKQGVPIYIHSLSSFVVLTLRNNYKLQ